MKRLEFESLPEEVRESLEMLHLPGEDEAECLRELQRVSEAYPGFVPGRLNLAALQLQSGDTAAADATYRGALSDFPDEQGAIGGLATVHAARREFDEAEQLARQALDGGYEWAPLYEVIAEAREHAGDTPAASEAYLASYRRSPHSWKCLEHYCRLNSRPYTSPLQSVERLVDDEALDALFQYIDEAAHTPGEDGEIPGCDHTFRFTEQWANQNRVDIIDLYQFLNAYGGFCDCEVCFNVESALLEDDYDDEEE